ncbi:MAG: ParB/RepB/Spo0J family partition protein [Vicinamibacterales bacterium]
MSPRPATAPLEDAPAPPVDRLTMAPPDGLQPGYHELPIRMLRPSPLNPRRHVTDVDDLAASIRAHGILEPLLGRATATGVEIVAGERRYRAAKAAGLSTVPVLLRELTDAGVVEHAIVENNQRADVHPLDEADAFHRLQALDADYTLDRLAATIGRPLAYVRNRLRLLTLIGDARRAFNDGQLTLGHAQLLAKLTPELQGRALKSVCFETEFDYETGKGSRIVGPQRLSDLQHFVNEHVRLDPAAVDTQEEFPELAADVAAAGAAGATVLMLVDEWSRGPAKPGDPLTREQFTEVKKGAKGAQLGVFVQGRRRGKTVWVTPVAKKAAPAPPPAPAGKGKKAPTPSPKAKAAAAAAKAEEDLRQVRSREVERRAVVQLAKGAKLSHLQSAPALRLLAGTLAGGPGFDLPELQAAGTALGVPSAAFEYSDQARRKLPIAKLAAVVAVQIVGAVLDDGYGANDILDDVARTAFAAFGVDVKAIDKAVAKEQAKAAAKTTAPAGSAAAAKRKAGKKR